MVWILAAVASAVFSGVTSILSKCGVKRTGSNLATAIRTSVVFVLAWAIVALSGEFSAIFAVRLKSWIFLLLSGVATGVSWICYFKALSLGEVSKVVAVDKSSVVLSVSFAMLLFPEERTRWWVRLLCLAAIAVGTYLMTDIRKSEAKERNAWFAYAALSAIFAAAMSLLAKIGIEDVPSNLATAIRTSVVLLLAWGIVAQRKEMPLLKDVPKNDLLFLCLSGVATAASWLCYYYAIRQGQVSVVVPIDKASVLLTVLFSACVLHEKISKRAWLGLALLACGALFMAIIVAQSKICAIAQRNISTSVQSSRAKNAKKPKKTRASVYKGGKICYNIVRKRKGRMV